MAAEPAVVVSLTGRPERSVACRYCVSSVVKKWVFRPVGASYCPDKREFLPINFAPQGRLVCTFFMVGIVRPAPAVDEKVCCFWCFVTLWNYKVCDNRNAVKQCNFQNNYGAITYRKVCSCIQVFLWIPRIFL